MNSDNRAEGWRIFIEYYPVMLRVEAALAACEWFADGWAISIRHFSGGIALQLYKTGWHNAAGRGIHLETWISIDGVADTSVPVVIHAEREVPGRERFNRMFIERSREIMAKWSGYRRSADPADAGETADGGVYTACGSGGYYRRNSRRDVRISWDDYRNFPATVAGRARSTILP
jgi:hypothetical protein